MTRRAVLVVTMLLLFGCAQKTWKLGREGSRPGDRLDPMRAAENAAREREWAFHEALYPGARAARRARQLETGDLAAFQREGEDLFFRDAPWDGGPSPPVSPLHVRGQAGGADATRCAACHHQGGPGGAGTFADLAFFDATGDDVLSAERRLPPMLAGAALLECAARGHPERSPFGWVPGRPRSVRAMVAWSIETHLGAHATSAEIDALVTYIASLAPPGMAPLPRDSLVLRAAAGAERFRTYGCATCHAESLDVDSPIIELGEGRRIDVSAWLSATGRPPFAVHAFTDLRAHRVIDADPTPYVTPPLWGVASRGPFLHDGRASSLREAIVAHDGEARAAREAWSRDQTGQQDLMVFLFGLSRPASLSWVR